MAPTTKHGHRRVRGPKKLTKIQKILKILVKLATSNCVDYYGRLVDNNTPMKNYDVEKLIQLAMRRTPTVWGQEAFVNALNRAGVSASLIENIDMRRMLHQVRRKKVDKLARNFKNLSLNEMPTVHVLAKQEDLQPVEKTVTVSSPTVLQQQPSRIPRAKPRIQAPKESNYKSPIASRLRSRIGESRVYNLRERQNAKK